MLDIILIGMAIFGGAVLFGSGFCVGWVLLATIVYKIWGDK